MGISDYKENETVIASNLAFGDAIRMLQEKEAQTLTLERMREDGSHVRIRSYKQAMKRLKTEDWLAENWAVLERISK